MVSRNTRARTNPAKQVKKNLRRTPAQDSVHETRSAQTQQRLTLSNDRVIAGVCAGIAERFNTDPAAIRVLWALLTVFTALVPGIIVYSICWIAFPRR